MLWKQIHTIWWIIYGLCEAARAGSLSSQTHHVPLTPSLKSTRRCFLVRIKLVVGWRRCFAKKGQRRIVCETATFREGKYGAKGCGWNLSDPVLGEITNNRRHIPAELLVDGPITPETFIQANIGSFSTTIAYEIMRGAFRWKNI